MREKLERVALLCLMATFTVLAFATGDIVSKFVAGLGPIGIVVYIGLAVLNVLIFWIPSGIALAIHAVPIFGYVLGPVYFIVGETLGQATWFGLERYPDQVRRFAPSWLIRLIGWVDEIVEDGLRLKPVIWVRHRMHDPDPRQNGWPFIISMLLLRQLPYIPAPFIAVMITKTGISFKKFLLVMFIGNIPIDCAYTLSMSSTTMFAYTTATVLAVSLVWWSVNKVCKALAKRAPQQPAAGFEETP